MSDFKFPADVPGWLTEAEGRTLHELAHEKDVLEVGSFCGRSTVCLAQSAWRVRAVDPHDGSCVAGHEGKRTAAEYVANLNRYGVSRAVKTTVATIEQHAADTAVCIGWPPGGGGYDLAFIDAAHDYAGCRSNLFAAARLTRPGATFAVHDYGNPDFPGVKQACDEFFGLTVPPRTVDHLAVIPSHVPPARVLHLVTPCSRPGNLGRLAASVKEAWRGGLDVRWRVVLDPAVVTQERTDAEWERLWHRVGEVGGVVMTGRTGGHFGSALRNEAIDRIAEVNGHPLNWVAFLDDDNLLHPEFVDALFETVVTVPAARCLVVSQDTLEPEGDAWKCVRRLTASAGAGLGQIDTAQFAFRLDAVGNHLWPLNRYDGDGDFYLRVREGLRPAERVYIDRSLSWYNRLR